MQPKQDSKPDMSKITARAATLDDVAAIALLNAEAFGPGRFARTAYRVREGMPLVSAFCKVCVTEDGRIIAAVRFTPIRIGGRNAALLLGPLAVAPSHANQGYGRELIALGLEQAKADGIGLVLLVGDEPYYGKLGFQRVVPGGIALPGPVDSQRLLAAELRPGALAEAHGLVTADTGAR